MLTVKRANVLLSIPEEQKQEYLNKGFDVLNERGAVVEHTVPSDVNVLKKAYVDHIKEIEELKAKLANIKVEQSDSDLQADYDSLLSDYNDVIEENEQLKSTIAEYEAEIEDEKPAKKKTSKK